MTYKMSGSDYCMASQWARTSGQIKSYSAVFGPSQVDRKTACPLIPTSFLTPIEFFPKPSFSTTKRFQPTPNSPIAETKISPKKRKPQQLQQQKMCRGLEKNERERVKIKAFYLRLSLSSKTPSKSLPDSLTLHYLPRINGSPLEIDGSNVRPDSPAFVTLHRVVSASVEKPVFGSRERVAASQGMRFDVYLGEEKLLRGVFRRDGGGEWKVECKCALEGEVVGVVEVKAADVWVEVEGQAAMSEKVAVAVSVRRKRRRRGNVCWFQGLEDIPEEGEDEVEGCCCCSEEREGGSDGGDCEELESGKDGDGMEMEIEGVRLAVDVGIWVACLGVGYLVSSLSRIKLL